MKSSTTPDEAPAERWTLVRKARQLLTLRGASGPRRGPAQNDLSIVYDGAILIRNGVIEEIGSARRVENLAAARCARELDAAGSIVMPAFVDPDAVLVYPRAAGLRSGPDAANPRIRVISKHRLEHSGAAAAAELVRFGALSAGAHTGYAEDLRDTVRILRVHRELQAKPLRIRSIFSPQLRRTDSPPAGGNAAETLTRNLTGKWLASVRERKLAAIVELALDPDSLTPCQLREVSMAATSLGYGVRIRCERQGCAVLPEVALAAGAVALLSPPGPPDENLQALAAMGCVHTLSLSAVLRDEKWDETLVRRELHSGIPLALASGFSARGCTTLNPQFLLCLAVRRLGMTAEEAIVATTYNAACSLRMSHITGSLEPGKSADLLLMDVGDYRDLINRAGHNDVMLAMKTGKTVYRRGELTAD